MILVEFRFPDALLFEGDTGITCCAELEGTAPEVPAIEVLISYDSSYYVGFVNIRSLEKTGFGRLG